MSAIAGIISYTYNEQIISAMLSTMQHRGPEKNKVFLDKECAMIHTGRAGNKHFTTFGNETGSFFIIFNGALYNKKELIVQLKQNGYSCATPSDAELVSLSYQCWGSDCLNKLNGVFTFAIWNTQTRSLFMARDRIGVKPLFYTLQNNGLIFATEMKTIFQHPNITPSLDEEGIAQILLLGPGRIPGTGVFHNMFELKPGTYLTFCEGSLECRRYWKLEDREHTESFEETAAHIRWLTTDAVNKQMITDSAVGCFLSGGLDSSIVSALSADMLQKEGNRLHTFSVDYQDNEHYFTPEKFQPETDKQYIDLMIAHIHCEHKQVILPSSGLCDELDTAVYARDLPGMADVDVSLLQFCREVRKSVNVALSGECADEIFGGYPWYTDPELSTRAGFPWSQNIMQRAAFMQHSTAKRIKPYEYVMDHYRSTLDASDILPGTSRQERRMKEMMQLNLWWFMQTLLDRNDRMSMYNDLDVRVPFCDYRIVEYMYAVPWSYKQYGNREKGILRYAMGDILPNTVAYRKKSPYPKTYDPKYLEAVRNRLKSVLGNKASPIFQIVEPVALNQLLDAQFEQPWYGQLMRLPQTIAYMLQINSWMEMYNISVK